MGRSYSFQQPLRNIQRYLQGYIQSLVACGYNFLFYAIPKGMDMQQVWAL